MKFIPTPVYSAIQKSHTQQHPHAADLVFAQLTPEAETKWLPHWQFTAINAGAEKSLAPNAIFTTPHHGQHATIWYTVRHYYSERYVEFVRITPEEFVAHIELRVVADTPNASQTMVSYTFTPLSDEGAERLQEEVLPYFEEQMQFWEKALNHYLSKGSQIAPE